MLLVDRWIIDSGGGANLSAELRDRFCSGERISLRGHPDKEVNRVARLPVRTRCQHGEMVVGRFDTIGHLFSNLSGVVLERNITVPEGNELARKSSQKHAGTYVQLRLDAPTPVGAEHCP